MPLIQPLVQQSALRAGLASLLLVVLLAFGCGSSDASKPTPTPTLPTTVLTLRPILASTDLAVGSNRMVFALLGPSSAPVKASAAEVVLSISDGDIAVPQGQVEAVFRPWPAGPGGVFTALMEFPRAGTWLAEITPRNGEAVGEQARLVFQVKEKSATPALGSPAPLSHNRAAGDVSTLDELTTDPNPDRDLYAMSIAQALETGRPLVVTFATPAFCSSATCGPQVDLMKDLKAAFGDRASFIHVEIYANPKEMQGDPSKGMVSPTVDEWGLPSEPWTFVVDAQGRIAAKFEAFTSYEELEEALIEVLQS